MFRFQQSVLKTFLETFSVMTQSPLSLHTIVIEYRATNRVVDFVIKVYVRRALNPLKMKFSQVLKIKGAEQLLKFCMKIVETI